MTLGRAMAALVAAILVSSASIVLTPARPAFACTGPGPLGDRDNLGSVVTARILARAIDASGETPAVAYTIAVDRVLFGDSLLAGSELTLRDSGAYLQSNGSGGWVEGPPPCGTFGGDSGDYVIANLVGADAAFPGYQYQSGGLDRLYLGAGPGDPSFDAALADIAVRIAALESTPLPPDAGTGLAPANDARSAAGSPRVPVAVLMLLAGATAIRLMARRPSAG